MAWHNQFNSISNAGLVLFPENVDFDRVVRRDK
jgi:hypothetical protein